SPDDEKDTRSSHEYLNDLEKEYQVRALLVKSKRFFKKGTQSLPQDKPEQRLTKDFEAKYNNVKAKLALLSSSASASKASTDSMDESSVCSTPLPSLKKLDGAELISGPKTNKSILRIISLEREINPRNPQHAFKRCEACGSSTHTITDHYDNEWFKRGKALQAKKAEALKSIRVKSSNANTSKTLTKRHMNGVKSYLHKYVEQTGPKVVFGDDSTCTTEAYGSITCNGIVFTKCDEKRGTVFNSNKEVVMIAPRVRDVYVLDMTSSAQESCFFAKAFENLNWLWHKRLAHLNFKTINKLVKQNLVIGLPSLVYSKDKPCSSCEKEKHHRANFKTKQTSSIKKCLHLLYMDLFGHVTPRSINHEKYTLVIIDEFSRNLKTPYEIFRKRIPNIKFLHVFGCPVYIHNQKDPLGKFDEKADDGYLLGYSLVSKAFRVFNTRRQQTKETYHITFDENPDAVKFSKLLVENINIAKNKRYPPDEYLHPYKPSQRYQTNSNDVPFIEPYESPKQAVLETEVSLEQNGQSDQTTQTDEILNDNLSAHSNYNNDEKSLINSQTLKIFRSLNTHPL
nr:retrovirus-related Pol polyprotein from transposon TNT 1-94 [Tanacetum cinerariifolium]